MLDNLQKVVIVKPVDQIIDQIRRLISSGELQAWGQIAARKKTCGAPWDR